MTPKSHPILFSAPMIRAILDGRKSMTRRVVKPQPRQALAPIQISPWEEGVTAFKPGDFGVYREGTPSGRWGLESVIRGKYRVGDVLWVREAWAGPVLVAQDGYLVEKALYRERDEAWRDHKRNPPRWKSPRFMPRWASRITLEITAVRVERLMDISEDDAKAEGIGIGDYRSQTEGICGREHRIEFRTLWDSLHAKDGFDWRANPWVWVISFRRVKP